MMKALDRIRPRGDVLECGIEMGEILELHRDMELSELRRTETELTPSDPITAESSLCFQMTEIRVHIPGELGIENAVG